MVMAQVCQTKDPRFKTIRLQNCLNLLFFKGQSNKYQGFLKIKSKSNQNLSILLLNLVINLLYSSYIVIHVREDDL